MIYESAPSGLYFITASTSGSEIAQRLSNHHGLLNFNMEIYCPDPKPNHANMGHLYCYPIQPLDVAFHF